MNIFHAMTCLYKTYCIHRYREISIQLLLNSLQEIEGQKTNNGIHYRMQLLYANGYVAALVYTHQCVCARVCVRVCVCGCVYDRVRVILFIKNKNNIFFNYNYNVKCQLNLFDERPSR